MAKRPKGEYHVTKDGEIKAGKNGEGVAVIKAMRIVWELLPMKSNAMTS
jgi:hypothetical protein